MVDFKIQGKKNRRTGAEFEKKVRTDLESKGWIVCRWNNNIEIKEENQVYTMKMIQAKSNRFNMRTTGFPDFITFKLENEYPGCNTHLYEINGVECKSNGKLDRTEKDKCEWLLKNEIFKKILIASKTEEGIEYTEFA
jgi:hypothetical protein